MTQSSQSQSIINGMSSDIGETKVSRRDVRGEECGDDHCRVEYPGYKLE